MDTSAQTCHSRAVRSLALVLVVLMAAVGAGGADETAPAPPGAIPLPALAERAEATERLLRAAAADAAADSAIEAIEQTLDQTAAERRTLRARTREAAARVESRDVIDEVERGWLAIRDRLAKVRRLVAERLTEVETRYAELAREAETWRITLDAGPTGGVPPAALDRMRALVTDIDTLLARLAERRAALVELQARVALEGHDALEMLDLVAHARGDFRSALLRRDAAPLWDSASDPEAREGPRVGTVLAADLAALRAFAADRRPVLFLQGLLFVLLLGVTRSIRHRASAWGSGDPRAASPRIIFERNVSAAALVTLLCTPLFHPYPPDVVVHVVTVTALVPILRLLPALVGPALRPAVFAVAGLVALDQARELVGVAVLPARLVLLASLVAAAVTVGWLLRRGRLRAGPAAPGPVRGLVPLLRLAQGLLLVGIAGTLLGWVRLGRLLYVDVLFPAYLALAIFGALQVLRTTLDIVLRSGRAQQLRVVAVHGALVRDRLSRVLGLVGVLLWVGVCLRGVDLDGALVALAERVLDAELTIGSLTLRLGNVVAFALALVIAAYVARFVRFVLEEDVLTRTRVSRGVANTISATVHYALLALGFLFAVAASGIELSRFTILLGALGVGVGFGLQNVVNNFVSGLILLFERPVQLGDTIEVGGVQGEVQRIGIRSSTVRTWKGAEVIVPNASLIADQVTNWTLSDSRCRMDVRVGVAYGTAPRQVIDLLHEVACGHVDVLRQPAPVVLFLGFGESALDFELRAWTASFETSLQTKSELTLAVSEALAAAGIEIPFPQRDLHLRSVDAGAVRGLADAGGVPAAGATGVDAPADGEASVPVRGDGGAGRS